MRLMRLLLATCIVAAFLSECGMARDTTPPLRTRAAQIFQRLDQDGDKGLALDEVPDSFGALFRRAFPVADRDDNNVLRQEEFSALLRLLQGRRQRKRSTDVFSDASEQVQAARRTVTVNGREREFLVHCPDRPLDPAPVVTYFHGGGGSAVRTFEKSGFNALADTEGFIAVYPDGLNRHWNDGRDAQKLQTQRGHTDDVAYVRAVMQALAQEYAIDRSRIFATGVSNGAIMCHRLAAEACDIFAAIAPVVGGMAQPISEHFQPQYPVSLLVIQGDDDPLVPIGGGPIVSPRSGRGSIIPTTEAVEAYLQLNGITAEPVIEQMPDTDPNDGTTTQVHTYPPGPGGFLAKTYIIHGGGHHMPGHSTPIPEALTGKVPMDFDGPRVIWEFFESCPPRTVPDAQQ